MPRGGARPNSGPKKGSKFPKTLERIAVLERLRQRVYAETDVLLDAQLELAKGTHVVLFQGMQGWEEATTVEQIRAALAAGGLRVFAKTPDNRALEALFDRAFGKASQAVDVTTRQAEPIRVIHEYAPPPARA